MASIEERLKDAPVRLAILAACGFARTVEHLLTDERSTAAIEVAERFADGLATEDEVRAAEKGADAGSKAALRGRKVEVDAAWAAMAATWTAQAVAWRKAVAAVGRARQAAELAQEAAKTGAETLNHSVLDCILPPRIHHPFPAHVKGLATTIYEKRDWSLMPILADALEEMGLEAFAQHSRQPIHVKGCHILDSILGK